jgi:WD40 repeat protein
VAEITGTNRVELEGYAERPGTFVNFSPDGRFVLTGSHHGTNVHLFDASSGRHLRDLDCGTGNGLFAHHGGLVGATGTSGYSFWHADTGERLREVPGGGGCVGFAPDDSYYLVSDPDGHLRLRDAASDRDVAVMNFPATAAWNVAFASDARRFAVNNSTGEIQLWDLPDLRAELARLGLDWPDEHPGENFAPPR